VELLGDVGHVNLISVYLEILVSVHHRCMICTKHTIVSKSFSTHPIVLLGDEAHVEACFSLFEDSVSVSAR
jgi:hypothetical protein